MKRIEIRIQNKDASIRDLIDEAIRKLETLKKVYPEVDKGDPSSFTPLSGRGQIIIDSDGEE